MAERQKHRPFDEVTAEEEEATHAMKKQLHALYDAVLDEPVPSTLFEVLKKFGGNR